MCHVPCPPCCVSTGLVGTLAHMCGVLCEHVLILTYRNQLLPSLPPSDSAWPVFIFPEEVGTRCTIAGVNVLTIQSGVPGRSVGKLSIFNPADPSIPLVSWEVQNMKRHGKMQNMFFIEIGWQCEGGPGLVWMYAGWEDTWTLHQMLVK